MGQMDKTIKVVIADDHMIVMNGLRFLLERRPDMEAVAEADNGRIALKLVKELSPGAKMLAKAKLLRIKLQSGRT